MKRSPDGARNFFGVEIRTALSRSGRLAPTVGAQFGLAARLQWQRRMRRPRILMLPMALLTVALLGGAEGIDKGELECEEAVKHLIDCCPNDAVPKAIDCYVGRGCDDHAADLTPAQSVCLRDSSCDDLYASGACNAPARACLP